MKIEWIKHRGNKETAEKPHTLRIACSDQETRLFRREPKRAHPESSVTLRNRTRNLAHPGTSATLRRKDEAERQQGDFIGTLGDRMDSQGSRRLAVIRTVKEG